MSDKEENIVICQFQTDVANYIGGYVIRKVRSEVNCSTCESTLTGNRIDNEHSLIAVKDNGGLIYPSENTKRIFSICEKLTSESLNIQNCLNDKFFLERTRTRIIRAVMESIPNLSSQFDEHFSTVLKQIVNTYVVLRCKYFAKSTNIELKKSKTRQKMSKIILFNHF